MTPSLIRGIEVHCLTHRFGEGDAATPVLRELSLRLRPGEMTLVMGASGSGKSTLLAALGGLLRPQAGEVRVLGTAIWSLDRWALERFRFQHYGFVFQGFNLFSALTARQQVALPLCFAGVPEAQAKRRADLALDEVGMIPRAGLRPAQLSGGEKQRVAIARALVTRPAVLFADEPTSALDSHNSDLVVALLRRIAAEHGTLVLAVTHDRRLAAFADRVVEMRDGAIVSDQPVAAAPMPATAVPA